MQVWAKTELQHLSPGWTRTASPSPRFPARGARGSAPLPAVPGASREPTVLDRLPREPRTASPLSGQLSRLGFARSSPQSFVCLRGMLNLKQARSWGILRFAREVMYPGTMERRAVATSPAPTPRGLPLAGRRRPDAPLRGGDGRPEPPNPSATPAWQAAGAHPPARTSCCSRVALHALERCQIDGFRGAVMRSNHERLWSSTAPGICRNAASLATVPAQLLPPFLTPPRPLGRLLLFLWGSQATRP